MSQVRKLITQWRRLKERADPIDRRMEGRTGGVVLHYRVGRLMGVTFPSDYEDADSMQVERD